VRTNSTVAQAKFELDFDRRRRRLSGTDVSLRNKNRAMIDLFVISGTTRGLSAIMSSIGDETFLNALQRSTMPVLAANTLLNGKPAGASSESEYPFAKIQPLIIKEIAGIKLAVIGVTTPGMPFWLGPEFTRGIEFQNPVEAVRRAIARAKAEGADVIVLSGHMGLKMRTGGDDFANTVMALTSEFPEIAVFIAGHTHQAIPSRLTNSALFTQADHFGIHVGRVDLLFDRNSKKLLHREAICELMDHHVHPDHVIVSRAKSQLAESDAALHRQSANWPRPCGVEAARRASDVERLIGAAISEALVERNVRVDGVMHGRSMIGPLCCRSQNIERHLELDSL
jgi:hypothetical protein